MSIGDNVRIISEKIDDAARKSGRTGADITLVGVSKTVEVPRILEAVECGVRVLGENKVQELLQKHPQIPDVSWHLIGHLQTNKVKSIVGKVSLIHSVDSLRLAAEIGTYAKKLGITADVLVQVNISGEATKFGIAPGELDALFEGIQTLENIRVLGLMTIAPLGATDSQTKKMFENCNKLFVDNKRKKYHNICMEVLSMGMTHDFEAAIESGASIVRIGTGIFGSRNYQI